MTETCRTCRWFTAEKQAPHFGKKGTCAAIHPGMAGDRLARLYPITGGAWLGVSVDFSCKLHEHQPKDQPHE